MEDSTLIAFNTRKWDDKTRANKRKQTDFYVSLSLIYLILLVPASNSRFETFISNWIKFLFYRRIEQKTSIDVVVSAEPQGSLLSFLESKHFLSFVHFESSLGTEKNSICTGSRFGIGNCTTWKCTIFSSSPWIRNQTEEQIQSCQRNGELFG